MRPLKECGHGKRRRDDNWELRSVRREHRERGLSGGGRHRSRGSPQFPLASARRTCESPPTRPWFARDVRRHTPPVSALGRTCGPQTVTPRHVDVSSNDLFEVSCNSRGREEVVGEIPRELNEEVHVAIVSVLRAHNGADHRDVEDAPLPKIALWARSLTRMLVRSDMGRNLRPPWCAQEELIGVRSSHHEPGLRRVARRAGLEPRDEATVHVEGAVRERRVAGGFPGERPPYVRSGRRHAVQHAAHRRRQHLRRKRLLQQLHLVLEQAMMQHDVVGVP